MKCHKYINYILLKLKLIIKIKIKVYILFKIKILFENQLEN